MASPGRLFLLLVSSSLLLSTVRVSASPNQNQLTANGELVRNSIGNIKDMLVPFLGVITPQGALIAAVSNLVLGVLNKNLNDRQILDAVKYEFESLNIKLDNYHEEQTWEEWTSTAYHVTEKDIEAAWSTYEKLVLSFQKPEPENTERLKHDFLADCSKCRSATQDLHMYLTIESDKKNTLIKNLGKMLAEHVKCHEKDIRGFTLLFSKLIYKGNTMNQLCYKLNKIESQDIVDDAAKIAYESASAMFQIHKKCISDSIKYIEEDVKGLFDNNIKHQELANRVRSFLAEAYDRYDWMVVAFTTKNSKHDLLTILNKHVLSEFTEVTDGDVTVAVARQVKGSHTKAEDVKRAIDRCIPDTVSCHKVEEKLSECKEIKDSQPYTAVHAFISEGHESHDAYEFGVFVNSVDPNIPYIYKGNCKKYKIFNTGTFVVMIKSDEERMTKDPCSELNCGDNQRGRCVRVEDTFVAMCECNQPYYGKNCELSLDDYKKALREQTEI